MFFLASAAGDRRDRASDAGGKEGGAPVAKAILRSSVVRVGCAVAAAGAVVVGVAAAAAAGRALR
jgi:hypothetical protein